MTIRVRNIRKRAKAPECLPVGTLKPHIGAMEGYFIGSGAILQAGERGKIIGATLHAQLAGDLAPSVVLIDFEGTALSDVRQLLAVVSGYSIAVFDTVVASRLLATGECNFDDVVRIIADSTDSSEVHLYSHWKLPAEAVAALERAGIGLYMHPLEEVSRAALIAQHRYQAWQGGVQAA